MKRLIPVIVLFLGSYAFSFAQPFSKVWSADKGDGTYRNPIIHADYSDPDVIRVGDDFYMTASSFNAVPGLPILHSKDLVNWKLINHALKRLYPEKDFSIPQHGNGVWAPYIRFHKGEFYIFWGDPDRGIFMTKTADPAGELKPPVMVNEAKGSIDPSPLWDDDGNAYLVHAFAGSRAGIKSILVTNRLDPAGTHVTGDSVLVFDGHDDHPTVEGPKFHKLNGYYYISAPAGGVATGWQVVLRSKNIFGPYELRTVLSQGTTQINGPHQGALVDTPSGEWWFIHFQDKQAYGRVAHLQPVVWKDDFPVIGVDPDGDGIGEPVSVHRKPDVGKDYPVDTPPDTDEFNSSSLGLQWQWHANPSDLWGFPFPSKGVLRMFSVQTPSKQNGLWGLPNLLLQKFPAEEFAATTSFRFDPRIDGEKFGFVVMGLDHSYISVTNKQGKLFISQATVLDADKGNNETIIAETPVDSRSLFFRVSVTKGSLCTFSYSTDGKTFKAIGSTFKAREGKWIGAKLGFFFTRESVFNDGGSVDIDWIRFEKVK